jgi:hypothetical protein
MPIVGCNSERIERNDIESSQYLRNHKDATQKELKAAASRYSLSHLELQMQLRKN